MVAVDIHHQEIGIVVIAVVVVVAAVAAVVVVAVVVVGVDVVECPGALNSVVCI